MLEDTEVNKESTLQQEVVLETLGVGIEQSRPRRR